MPKHVILYRTGFSTLLIVLGILLSLSLPARALPAIQEVTSPGGIHAWLVEDHRLPLFTLAFGFQGGVERDPADKQGLAVLTASLLAEGGAGPWDALTFQRRLANHGISFSVDAGRDAVRGVVRSPRDQRGVAVTMARLALTAPRLDPRDFERLRDRQKAAVRTLAGDTDWQARAVLLETVFPNHPYHQRSLGTEKTLNNLTLDDVRGLARGLTRARLVVTAAGALTPQELGKVVDQIFGALPAALPDRTLLPAVWPETPVAVEVPREGEQTRLMFALPLPRPTDPDWEAVEVANWILGGGGLTSRLAKAVREDAGLTYGIGTGLAPMELASFLMGKTIVSNAEAGRVQGTILDVWQRLRDEGPSQEDVARAQDYVIGALPLALTSTASLAEGMLELRLDHRPPDEWAQHLARLRAVTLEDVRRVLDRWLDPSRLTWVALGAPHGMTFTRACTVPDGTGPAVCR